MRANKQSLKNLGVPAASAGTRVPDDVLMAELASNRDFLSVDDAKAVSEAERYVASGEPIPDALHARLVCISIRVEVQDNLTSHTRNTPVHHGPAPSLALEAADHEAAVRLKRLVDVMKIPGHSRWAWRFLLSVRRRCSKSGVTPKQMEVVERIAKWAEERRNS